MLAIWKTISPTHSVCEVTHNASRHAQLTVIQIEKGYCAVVQYWYKKVYRIDSRAYFYPTLGRNYTAYTLEHGKLSIPNCHYYGQPYPKEAALNWCKGVYAQLESQ